MEGQVTKSIPLIRAPQPGEFELVRRPASKAFAGVVTGMTGYRETAEAHFFQQEVASLVVPLVIGFGGPFGIGVGSAAPERCFSFTAGLWAGPVAIESFGDAHCLQVNFTPLGARRFFGVPMSELASRLAEPDALVGRGFVSLRAQLGDTGSWAERFDLVEAFLLKRLHNGAAPPRQVALAYRHILESGGRARIERVASDVEWSRKHLAAMFADQIGLTPKSVARIVRIERAVEMARSGDADNWADLAAACGFADQPHLVSEFQALAGASPAEWMARAP